MNTYTVSFFGHRMIDNALKIESRLEQLIQALLREHEYVEFLVGRDGEFDQLVSSAIRRCKREYCSDDSAHIWVLPYITAEFRDNEESFRDYYDEIEVCEAAAGSHYKNAHQTRNRAMVDRSDLVVFCIQRGSGAWQTMKYVKQQRKPYINLHDQRGKRNEKMYLVSNCRCSGYAYFDYCCSQCQHGKRAGTGGL